MTPPIRALMVDDDEDDFLLVRDLLLENQRQPIELEWESTFDAGLAALSADAHDIYLVDYRLGRGDGLEMLRRAVTAGFTGPSIVLTGHDDDRVDLDAMQAGAADYLVKEQLTPQLLGRTITHSIERSRIQGELRRALEETIRAKDSFLASISHRLRTPLTAVLGFAELLQEQTERLPAKQRAAMVTAIAANAADMANTIEDLLVVARIDLSQLSVARVPVALAAEVERVLDAIPDGRARAEVRNGLPPSQHAIGDPARVRQIVRHLLANATQYGGPRIEIRLDGGVGVARLQVADDGPGPSTIEPERMFDPYEALHAAAGQPDSLGIGLDIARRLARLMGGDVTYRLDTGWSVFELTLPSEPPEPGEGDPPGTGLRVA